MPGLVYGVRATIYAICALVAIYDRHRVNCMGVFPENVIGALDLLSDGCDNLRSLNPPGPL